MRIEGSVRSNLIAAVASARRWRGRPVHKDTVDHWRGLLLVARKPCGEAVSDLVAELETEIVNVNVRRVSR
jgi:hypothetical protein